MRVLVVSFDIDQSAIAAGHHHRNAPVPGCFTHRGLDVQRVAFLDHYVEAVEEAVDRVLGDAGCRHGDRQVGVEFGDPSRCHDRLVHADVEHGCRNPVQVRQLEGVEVGEPQFAAQSLGSQRVGDRVPDGQAHHTDPQSGQRVLLREGDHVAVAVQPQPAKSLRAGDGNDRPTPRVVRPAHRLGEDLRIWSGTQRLQSCRELGCAVDEFDR